MLLEGATLEQNIAMVFTLEIEPVPPDTAGMWRRWPRTAASATRSVTGEALPTCARACTLRVRSRCPPALLVLEHPTAGIPDSGRVAYAETFVAVTEARLAALVITQDEAFASLAGHRALRLEPVTGALKPVRRGWFR